MVSWAWWCSPLSLTAGGIKMQLFTLKFGQDTDDSMPILVEPQLKGISSDPKLQNLRFLSHPLGTTSIPVLTAISGTTLRTMLSIWSTSLLWAFSHVYGALPASAHLARWAMWSIPSSPYASVWRPVTLNHANVIAGSCCTSSALLFG